MFLLDFENGGQLVDKRLLTGVKRGIEGLHGPHLSLYKARAALAYVLRV